MVARSTVILTLDAAAFFAAPAPALPQMHIGARSDRREADTDGPTVLVTRARLPGAS
jgi:hypothetical protein